MQVPSPADNSATAKCIECSAEILPMAKFCLHCGASQIKAAPTPIKCITCGSELPEYAKFCSECGTVQAVSPTRPTILSENSIPNTIKSCPQCGAGNPAEYSFCSKCGITFSNKASSEVRANSPNQHNRVPPQSFAPRVESHYVQAATIQSRPNLPSPQSRPTSVLAKMTPQQKLYFQQEYDKQVRNPSTALVLTLLLGGIGAHRFYLKQWGWGITYVLFCWTWIPVIVSFFECFFIRNRTKAYNEQLAKNIRDKMDVIFSEPEIAVTMKMQG